MKLVVARLGVVPYGQALALQLELRQKLQAGSEESGFLLLLEHPPTVTLGKRGKEADLVSPGFLSSKGVEVFRIDRGGEATYHGPGQLVVYPILRLADFGIGVVDLIRGLAGSLCDSLGALYGISARYDVEHPGVWTTDEPSRKMGSVGMRVSGGVTTHGAALNLSNDMAPFSWIVPCGMPDAPMIRLAQLVGPVDFQAFQDDFVERFAEFLGADAVADDVALPERERWETPLAFD